MCNLQSKDVPFKPRLHFCVICSPQTFHSNPVYLQQHTLHKTQEHKDEVGGGKGRCHADHHRHVECDQQDWQATHAVRQEAKQQTSNHYPAKVDGGRQVSQILGVAHQVPLFDQSRCLKLSDNLAQGNTVRQEGKATQDGMSQTVRQAGTRQHRMSQTVRQEGKATQDEMSQTVRQEGKATQDEMSQTVGQASRQQHKMRW